MYLLLFLLGIFIVIGGSINYVYAIVNKKKNTKKQLPGLFIAFFVDSVIMLVVNVFLLRNPKMVYTYLHWGWILGINIGLFVLVIVMGILLAVKGFKMIMATTQIMVGICSFALMFFGMSLSYKTVYNISSAKEFNILSNLPGNNIIYQIKICSDIDFSGVDVNNGFGRSNLCFYIDGQGYTLKNVKYETTINDSYTTFLRMGYGYKDKDGKVDNYNDRYPKISNLVIQDCEFTITPNYFDSYSHEGRECSFCLFDSHTSFVNVDIVNTKIFVKKSPPDIRHDGVSTIKNIYPSNSTENGCNISLEIVYEE